MELSNEDVNLIKKHLLGRLNPSQEQVFEQRLDKDENFRAELRFHTLLFAAFKDKE